jgi:hypothetical protein
MRLVASGIMDHFIVFFKKRNSVFPQFDFLVVGCCCCFYPFDMEDDKSVGIKAEKDYGSERDSRSR